jgi:hypothetical protein
LNGICWNQRTRSRVKPNCCHPTDEGI